jgi:hypothetical protein
MGRYEAPGSPGGGELYLTQTSKNFSDFSPAITRKIKSTPLYSMKTTLQTQLHTMTILQFQGFEQQSSVFRIKKEVKKVNC